MRCPSCSSENLPIRETSTIRGSEVRLPSNCSQCGHALTEKCPVCTYNHAIGTRFCQANGANIEKWVSEENAWKVLVQNVNAMLSVRPARAGLAYLLAALPGLYFVGGFWFREITGPGFYPWNSGDYILSGILAVVTTLFCMALPAALAVTIVVSIERHRRRRLFEAQGFTTLKPEDRVIDA